MADEEKTDDDVKEVEFKVSMYCNACERSVAKTISKFKGVETFMTDMNEHKVVVTGCINPEKLLKKLRKKTGKRVEIVEKENDDEEKEEEEEEEKALEDTWNCDCDYDYRFSEPLLLSWPPFFDSYYYYCYKDNDVLMMFSDENPNACSVM